MRYKLNITLHADELLENIIEYVAVQLSNKSVAISILEDVEKVYNVLEERAEAFPYCEDPFLAAKKEEAAARGFVPAGNYENEMPFR